MRPIATSAAVRIDPTTLVDHPLSKERIAVYNSGLVPIDRYRRDADHIAAVSPESLRIDLGWGAEWMPWTREVVRASEDGTLAFDFTETDDVARVLRDAGTRPYWSYCYVPEAARDAGQDWRTMGRDDSVWVRTVGEYVAGMRHRGVDIGYHEVYNEPDLRDERTAEATFYTGQLEDYLDLYRATAPAIRAADPTARVGGPALAVAAVHAEWLDAFLRTVSAEGLPLDFLSFHHYGHFGLASTLRTVREILAAHPAQRHVELHLNEYNAFGIDYPRGGLQDTHMLASTFAADIPRLLAHRELTRTHWAQFLDSGQGNFSGMVDIDGTPKPIHAVYRFYQAMPVDRVRADVDGPPGLGAIASSDSAATCAIVWNRHSADLSIDVHLGVERRDLAAVVIDAEGVGSEQSLTTRNGTVSVELPTGAVALLRAGAPRPTPGRRVAWGVPVVADAAHRGWAELDEATTTFRLRPPGGGGWVVHGAEVPADLAAEEWQVTVCAPDGTPIAATVALAEHDSDRITTHQLAGDGAPRWDELTVDRPVPAGSRRVYVAAAAAANAFVRVAPRGRLTA